MSPARDERPVGHSAAPRGPAVSVVVPFLNPGSMLVGCLAALDAQTLDPDRYEVIVVDDGSTDGSAERARAFASDARSKITVVRLEENRGPAAARNAGLARAGAPVIAFTDVDCEPAADWLERGLALLAADPELAGVEGRTEPKGTPTALTHQMRNTTGGLWMTCNMLYRRSSLDEIGGFDERFRLAFLEDSDIAFAIQERGGRIAWAPDVLVWHLVLPAGRAKFGREARKRFYNPLLYAKHPDLYVRHLRPVVPGLPGLHVKYMVAVSFVAAFAVASLFSRPGFWGGVLLASLVAALYLKRLAYAYRARDVVTIAQVAMHPFVQTFWVLRGAVRFRAFSPRL